MTLLRRAFDWWLAQVKHVLPPTIFFFVGFNLILFTRWMTLQEHGIPFTNFFARDARGAAGRQGGAGGRQPALHAPLRRRAADPADPVQVRDLLGVRLRVPHRRGALPLPARRRRARRLPGFLDAHFSWPRFLAIQIWLMVLFLVYVTAHELNTLFGDGELARLFLRWHSSEAKLTRRQRIRLLTRLNRLTEANPVEVISEKGSRAHTELVGILQKLAERRADPARDTVASEEAP
jgi:hypothetical protein